MKIGVEEHPVSGQGARVIDEAVLVVALQFHVLVGGRPGVVDLVFMKIKGGRDVSAFRTGEGQEGRQVEHVGGQEEIGAVFYFQKLLRQNHRPAVHAPLPVPAFQREDLHIVAAVFLEAFGPLAVAAGEKWFEQDDFHTVHRVKVSQNFKAFSRLVFGEMAHLRQTTAGFF